MWRFGGTLAALFAGSVAGALALHGADLGHLPWAVSRASGLAAFATLSASVILGLAISTKASDGVLGRPFVFAMHQFLAVASLALMAVHAGSLLFDSFLPFSPQALVVPFVSNYRPVAVSAGVIAAWLAAITTASFWVRARIGARTWRRLHYLTFGAYLLALLHGVTAGTDTYLSAVYWGYLVSAGAVAALTVLRITGYRETRPHQSRARQGAPASNARTTV
jgi:sulfoxide reductase heme-binding subunit YedZ